jgi:acyl-coenzyme A thioesterase PaaI-like protein
MDKDPYDVLKTIFDKVNSEDTFAKQIGMNLIEIRTGFARAILLITDEKVNPVRKAGL